MAQTPWQGQVETRICGINERLVFAQQGKWKTLFDLSMKVALPTYDPSPEDEILDEHGLSKEMAHKLHAAACQGQVGKAWKHTRSPVRRRNTQMLQKSANERKRAQTQVRKRVQKECKRALRIKIQRPGRVVTWDLPPFFLEFVAPNAILEGGCL